MTGVRGYGAGGQRPTWLRPGALSGQVLGGPSTARYPGALRPAAEEWWLGVPSPAIVRVSTGDQGTWSTFGVHQVEFLDHLTPITAPVVRSASAGRVTGGPGDVTSDLPADVTVGDLVLLLACHRSPVAAPDGWTVAETITAAGGYGISWGNGFLAWRILDSADVAAGSVTWWAPAGQDPFTPDGAWTMTAVQAGTFDPSAPVTGTQSSSWADQYADIQYAYAPMSWQPVTGSTLISMVALTGPDVVDLTGNLGVPAWWTSSPAAGGVQVFRPLDAVQWPIFEIRTYGVDSCTVGEVLVAPVGVATGGLSGGLRVTMSTRTVPSAGLVDDEVTGQYLDLIDALPDPLAGGVPAVRARYQPIDDGQLTVVADSSTGSDVDLWVVDDTDTVIGSGTGTVTVPVTGDASYWLVVAPSDGDTAGSADLVLEGPPDAAAVPSEWEAPAAPTVPALTPYTGEPVLWRVSPQIPAPALTDGRPVGWAPTSETVTEWGVFRVIVDGQDVTRFRGVPCRIDQYQLMEPFGCGPARIMFPQVGPWEARTGDLDWLVVGADVDIVRYRPSTGASTVLWSGLVPARGIQAGPGGRSTVIDCIGDIWAGDLQIHKPRPYVPPQDLGKLISRALNTEVVSRRIRKVPVVSTGIECNKRGSSDQSVIGYVQELLSIYGTTADGADQWTIARGTTPRSYVLRHKASGSVQCTVYAGAHQEIALTCDATETPNVIFGSGVNSSGYSWAGWVYPAAAGNDYRVYPMPTSPLQTITVGTEDGDTTTGTGVTDLQERINDLGISGARVTSVDGVYSASDAADVRVVQDHFGLQVDGIVGPQTWAALFPQYPRSGLDGSMRLPLAASRKVIPRLYNADGTDAGENPDYDSSVLRVEVDRRFEAGITKREARTSAKAELARCPSPGWAGTITLSADPPECSRWDLVEGRQVQVRGLEGTTQTLHVSGVTVRPPQSGDDPGQVQLVVDEYARDLLTLGAILARDRESRDDPVRLPTRKNRKAGQTQDAVVAFDGESPAGVIRKTALIGGLWVYVDIPVSQAGTVAKVELTTSPATKFTVAFFGDMRVTPAQMIRLVGANPLAEREDGFGPYDRLHDEYPWLGFLQGIGGPGQAAGYDPGYEDSPYKPGESTPVTGKLKSTAGWEYQSTKPPFLRVFFWAPSACTIRGRVWPAPLEA